MSSGRMIEDVRHTKVFRLSENREAKARTAMKMQMTANHLCNDDVLCRIAPASSSPESATLTKRWSRAGFESLCDRSCAFVRLELKDTDSKTVESISSAGEHLVSDQGDAGSSPA